MPEQHTDEEWPSKIDITLDLHMTDVRRLLRQAAATRTEYQWYHSHNSALSFNGLRMSSQAFRISIYPQARLKWFAAEDSHSSSPNTDSKAESTTQAPVDPQDSTTDDSDTIQLTDRIARLSMSSTQDAEETSDSSTSTSPNVVPATLVVNDSDDLAPRRSPRARKPVVKYQSAPRAKQQRYSRYPDLAVMTASLTEEEQESSANGVKSIHSLWEIKQPVHDARLEGPLDDRGMKVTQMDLEKSCEDEKLVRQVLEQVKGAFSLYSHQDYMYVVIVRGYWLRVHVIERAKLPEDVDTFAGYSMADMMKYIPDWGTQDFFPLLAPDMSDYSTPFKKYWTAATTRVHEAVEKHRKMEQERQQQER